jgi:hypothetical protein
MALSLGIYSLVWPHIITKEKEKKNERGKTRPRCPHDQPKVKARMKKQNADATNDKGDAFC